MIFTNWKKAAGAAGSVGAAALIAGLDLTASGAPITATNAALFFGVALGEVACLIGGGAALYLGGKALFNACKKTQVEQSDPSKILAIEWYKNLAIEWYKDEEEADADFIPEPGSKSKTSHVKFDKEEMKLSENEIENLLADQGEGVKTKTSPSEKLLMEIIGSSPRYNLRPRAK